MNDFPVHTKEIIGYTFLKRIKSHKKEELFKIGQYLILSVAVTYPVTNIITRCHIIAELNPMKR